MLELGRRGLGSQRSLLAVTTKVRVLAERLSVTTGVGSDVVTVTSILEDSMSVTVSVFADKVKVSVKVEPGTSDDTSLKLPDSVLKLVSTTIEADSVEVQAGAETVVVMTVTDAEAVAVWVTS